jgi:hypothetical protein
MDMKDWLTLAALISGPAFAVGITLWIEGQRRRRDSRLIVLRQLIATRHLPGDPMYSTAINLIPVEFNDDERVMAAYKAYQEVVSVVPPGDADAAARCNQNVGVKQTKLIFAIMQAMKLRASEADIPVEAYAARGMTARDELWLNSLRGTVRIADALELQTRLIAGDAQPQQQLPSGDQEMQND